MNDWCDNDTSKNDLRYTITQYLYGWFFRTGINEYRGKIMQIGMMDRGFTGLPLFHEGLAWFFSSTLQSTSAYMEWHNVLDGSVTTTNLCHSNHTLLMCHHLWSLQFCFITQVKQHIYQKYFLVEFATIYRNNILQCGKLNPQNTQARTNIYIYISRRHMMISECVCVRPLI